MTTKTEQTPAPAAAPQPERVRYVTPAVAIYEDPDGYTVEAEMPGVGKEGVHVTVENGELAFTGAKAPRPPGACLYGEAARADFRRAFDLDPSVDATHITAHMDQGILVLRLPKAQEKKPRRIAVS